jgi:glyceraldehyde-3-phosphate dehydrogenase/erythrose-4-phosphate dehydrogenase
MKPSIFDTEETQNLKQSLSELQEYHEEIEFLNNNKDAIAQFEKEKALNKEDDEPPEGFGKP